MKSIVVRIAAPLVVAAASLVTTAAHAAVGRTAGQAEVSSTGMAAYAIPIFAPRGVNGMTPSLSLVYSGGLGSGPIGEGWAISGQSAISRCPRTIAQDGAARAVKLDSADRFCRDGRRLRLASGTYGAAGAQYRTEIESYARVTSLGSVGGGPASFKVEQKDGLVYEYGVTADSQIEAQGLSVVREWALSRITDRVGNAIVFTYAEDSVNGSYQLDYVDYTSNSGQGLAAAYRIDFTYENQPTAEVDIGYVGGRIVRDVVRLTRVDVSYTGSVVRRYSLVYESSLSSTSKSRVQSIQECADASGTECLPVTSFTYQNGAAGVGSEVTSATGLPATANLPIDVNGDGRTDIVYSSSATAGSGTWRVMLANTSGGFNAPIDSGIANTNFTQAIPIDYNGDGLEDFLVPYSGGTWWAVLGTTSGLASPVNTAIAATGAGGNARAMDIDGDGLDDLVYAVVTGASHSVQARLRVAGGTFAAPVYLYGPVSSPYAIVGPVFGDTQFSRRKRNPDINGDGVADFLVHTTESDPVMGLIHSWEIVLNGSGGGVVYLGNFQMAGGPYWPDLNGDGCSDVVYTYANYWRYRFSSCTTLGPAYLGPMVAGIPQTAAVVQDWDADGFEDIVGVNTASSPFMIQYMRSTGSSLAAHATSASSSPTIQLSVGDVNGDGLSDLMYRNAGTAWSYQPHVGVAPDLIDTVIDGFGVTQNFDYGVLTDPALYTKYSGAPSPQVDVQGGSWVVKQLTATDRTGNGTSYTQAFTYEGARKDRLGRGFLGFAKRIATDSRVGYNLRTEETYLQGFPYTGLPASSILKQAAGGKVREQTHTWAQLQWSTPEPRALPYLAQSVVGEHEVAGAYSGTKYRTVTTAVAAISSTSGLVTDSTVTTTESATGLNTGAQHTVRTWHSSVLDDSSTWCLGRPQSTQVTVGHSLPGGSAVTRTTDQGWDSLYCRPTQIIDEPTSSTLKVTTTLGYDALGHVNSQSVSGIGMTARVTNFAWSGNGLYLATLTNPLGQASTQTWNGSFGVPASVTDPNGLATSWTYDSFGRRTDEQRPDLTSTHWSYTSCGACGDARLRYAVAAQSKSTSGAVIRTDEARFDAFDQEVVRLTPQAGGGVSQVRYDRDALGRVTRAYVPYWVGGASNGYSDTTFDLLNRTTGTASYTSTGALHSSSSIGYSGLTSTVTDSVGHSTISTALAWGGPARVTDAAGGSTNYQSNPLGQLTQMTDAYGTAVMQAVYNQRGMATSITNINRGTLTRVPNALGEVVSETDAKSQTRTYGYDLLGRRTSRTEPEGVSTWSWGTSAGAHNIGQLQSLSGPGYAESYTFDPYGRPATQTVTSDASYQIDFGYNAQGTLDTLTYPTSTTGYRLKLQYEYVTGVLSAIKDFNAPTTVIWALTTTDARGDVIDETLGANLKVLTGRHPLTGLLEYRQAGLGGGSALQNLTYAGTPRAISRSAAMRTRRATAAWAAWPGNCVRRLPTMRSSGSIR